MPSGEVDTSSLVSAILSAGKKLFVPKIDVTVDGRMDCLRVYNEDDLRSFSGGAWGIKEPSLEFQGARRPSALDESSPRLDLILFPGVAFDRSMGRLGHGKGYYDRFVSTYTSQKADRRPLFVALALREQILEAQKVPTSLYDWPMDVIVGPDGIVLVEGGTEDKFRSW